MTNLLRTSVSVFVALLAGCSQSVPQAIPIKAADSYATKAQSDGLAAGAQPFDTYVKSTNVLGKNVSREFTPVQLVVESTAPDKFLLHREGAKLICADGTALEPVSAIRMFQHYLEPVNIAVVIGTGLAQPALITNDSNARTMTDWVNKELPPVAVLKTGGRVGGLLYFRGTCPLRMGRRLHVTADKMASSDTVSLSIDLR